MAGHTVGPGGSWPPPGPPGLLLCDNGTNAARLWGWMAFYALTLLHLSLALAAKDATYEDLATKFFEYFTYIAVAMDDQGLWDEGDAFFYDVLHRPDGSAEAVRVLSIVSPARLVRILTGMLDEAEFLPPHRIRALSRRHAGQPYTVALGDATARVDYEPGESQTGPFGGNSNWRVRCGSR